MVKKCVACGKEVKNNYIAVPVWNGVKYYHSFCDVPKEISKKTSSPKPKKS